MQNEEQILSRIADAELRNFQKLGYELSKYGFNPRNFSISSKTRVIFSRSGVCGINSQAISPLHQSEQHRRGTVLRDTESEGL